jgi:hypothetical protein
MASVTTTKSPTTETKTSSQSTNTFGTLVDKLQSLFGSQSRNESQNFSTKPASENLGIQNYYADQAAQSQLALQKQAIRYSQDLSDSSYKSRTYADSNAYKSKLEADVEQQMKLNNLRLTSSLAKFDPQQMDYTARLEKEAANDAFQRSLVQGERDRYNQSLISQQEAQQQANLQNAQLAAQRQLAQIQSNTQLKTAELGAQGNIIASLFGSISSGSPNYRYWN